MLGIFKYMIGIFKYMIGIFKYMIGTNMIDHGLLFRTVQGTQLPKANASLHAVLE